MKIRTDFEFLYPILVGVVVCGVIGTIVYDKYITEPERAIQRERDTASWAAKGCPVYKSSCGSYKAPYACERRGDVVGRNQVGDIFVDAYPICEK